MSEASPATVVGVHARAQSAVSPMRRVRQIGYSVLGLQLVGFLVWSAVLYDHSALTWDFATYNQPWFLIAHGNLDPYSTISRIPFWQNDAEFMIWVLAPVYWLARSGLALLWLQDLSVWGAGVVIFGWICEVAEQRCGRRDAVVLASLGLLLLVANPWTWWTVSFDVHEEALVIVFVALLARDMACGRRRACAWVVPLLLGGAPTSSYVIGIGLGGILAGRRTRATGLGMVVTGLCYTGFLVLVHGNVGVPLPRHFGYLATANGYVPPGLTVSGLLKGIATHPFNVVRALWSKRVDLLANAAPGGLMGLFVPLLMPLLLLVLVENALSHGANFVEPTFQSVPLYVLMPAGTVVALIWLARRHRRTAIVLVSLLAAQAIGWAVVWGPVTLSEWLRVPGSTAATLAGIEARIPASAEVIASQGVVGAFSSRVLVYGLSGPGTFPLHGQTWFVLTPYEGVETLNPASTQALLGELAGPLHATLVTQANGVWAFLLTPPPGVQQITVPDGSSPLPAWTAAGVAGLPVLAGQVSGWHVTATGAKGYVADGIEWLEQPGLYSAEVTLSAAGPVNVEVWDDTSDTLLARRMIPQTSGTQQVVIPVVAPDAPNATVYSGWGPFRANFVSPPPGQRLEVRVWSPGGAAVNVYSADLTAVSGSGPAAQS
jgi:hypothetical protein